MKKRLFLLLASGFFAQTALADFCDYRPSKSVGSAATGVVAGGTAVTGIGMKVAGIYAITNATTGAVMLGSTAAGSAGIIGTVGAVLLSPFVLIPAAVTAVGAGAYEGGCYLADK